MNIYKFTLLSLLIFFSHCSAGVTSTIDTNYGCLVPTNLFTQGFNVKLFDYPLLAKDYLTSSFYYSDYRTLQQISLATAIPGAPSFLFEDYASVSSTSLWNIAFNPNHFLGEFTTYLLTPETGFYEFYFGDIDDGCMAFIGNGAFACCEFDEISMDAANQQILYATYSSQTGATGDAALIYLVGNISYLLRIVYVNANRYGSFSFNIMLNGQNFPVENYLFVLPSSVTPSECTSSAPGIRESTGTTPVGSSDTAGTNSNGAATDSNGQPTNSDGAATNSNGQPTNSATQPTDSNGNPVDPTESGGTNSDSVESSSDGKPAKGHGIATNSNGKSNNSDVAATNSNGKPTNSDATWRFCQLRCRAYQPQ